MERSTLDIRAPTIGPVGTTAFGPTLRGSSGLARSFSLQEEQFMVDVSDATEGWLSDDDLFSDPDVVAGLEETFREIEEWKNSL